MGIQVICYKDDFGNIWVISFRYFPHHFCKVAHFPVFQCFRMPPSAERLCEHEYAGCPHADILRINFLNRPGAGQFRFGIGFHRPGTGPLPGLIKQLTGFSSMQATGQQGSYGFWYMVRISSIFAIKCGSFSIGIHQYLLKWGFNWLVFRIIWLLRYIN